MLHSKKTDGKRWPRGQKFALSPAGIELEESYRNAVSGSRASGRTALEAALSSWAGAARVAPGDGVVLAELRGKRLGVGDLARALEQAGIAPDEVRAAVGRLVDAGAVAPLPLASQERLAG
jgi:hypothetical protein